MSQTIVPPHPLTQFRRYVVELWDDPDSRSVLIGLLGVLFVHLLLFLLAPQMLRVESGASVLRPHSSNKQFNIEIAPDIFVPKAVPKPPPPFKFVETNPEAPDNVPDKTENFAARNQQVAQPKPTPDGRSDRPAIEGQKEIESTQIVDGRLTKPVETLPSAPMTEAPPNQAAAEAPRQEQNPLTGIEKREGDNEAGYGSNIAKFPASTRPSAEHVDGVKNAPLIQGAVAVEPQIDPRRPQPRPQIVKQIQTRPAIFQENKIGTQNIGLIGVSAQFSQYGLYLQKMIESIQIQWERLIIESKVYPGSGKMVTVKFRMDSQGQISQIVSVEGTAGNQAEGNCTTAITSRAPYGPWTPDMIAVLGESQEMTFSFYYQ
jgi:hypothetical protein